MRRQECTLLAWGKRVAVVLEQARGGLIYALMSTDFLAIYAVNPQSLAKYRKALYPSGAKSDPADAELLVEELLFARFALDYVPLCHGCWRKISGRRLAPQLIAGTQWMHVIHKRPQRLLL